MVFFTASSNVAICRAVGRGSIFGGVGVAGGGFVPGVTLDGGGTSCEGRTGVGPVVGPVVGRSGGALGGVTVDGVEATLGCFGIGVAVGPVG